VPDTESTESVAATDAAAPARAAPWTGDPKERLTMMIHPEIHAALVRERTRTFLAEAEAARRSRPLGRPLPRPSGGRPARLRDGSAVLIRPVRPEDAGLLKDSFAGLRYLTGVDHRDHEALGALAHARGGGVGIARYVRDREDPHAAEIAVIVIDGWQGRGLHWPACRCAGRS
jgi:hypothetical protein